jgi:hypothetical protein
LVFTIFRNRDIPTRRAKEVRKLAERLCQLTRDSEQTKLMDYITALCYRPELLMAMTCSEGPMSDARRILQAAIINHRSDVAMRLITSPKTSPKIFQEEVCVDLFFSPAFLAGQFGAIDILGCLLSVQECANKKTREGALKGAIYGGRLDVVEFILNRRWGPVNTLSSSRRIREVLASGMVESDHADFHVRLYNLLKSYDAIGFVVPDANELLDDIAGSNIQRPDIAAYLLDQGAVVQDRSSPPRNRVQSPSIFGQGVPLEPRRPYNPLRRAVKAGNEQIVRLLLDRGAEPNATDDDTLWQAARHGRMDLVRMLVEHKQGADVNHVPQFPIGSRRTKAEPPIVHAIMLEHKTMTEYFLNQDGILDIHDSGGEALMRAKAEGLDDAVRWLEDQRVMLPHGR